MGEKRIEYNRYFWIKCYGNILKEIFSFYKLDYFDFAKQYDINNSTIRYWFYGRNFPNKYSQESLFKYLTENLQNIHTSNIDNVHIYEYVRAQFGTEKKNLYENIKKNFPQINDFLIEILRCCRSLGQNYNKIDFTSIIQETGNIRVVVFDFDGTLTFEKTNRTIWENIWIKLGYNVEECQNLHLKFNHHEITHSDWCKLTEYKFIQKNLHRDDIENLANKIKLLPGVKETFDLLQTKGIKIYIVSGSILLVIQKTLKDLLQYVDGIYANQFLFDSSGFFYRIVGTKYDFEGKANFILELAKNLQISTKDILFIGNSVNDQFAYLSGAKTLCINHKLTDITNNLIWNECILECKDLKEIIKYIIKN